MSLHKICKSVNMASQKWRSYCLWRKMEFAAFDSLDSTIHNSVFAPHEEDDWNYAVTTDQYVTDVVNDFAFAKQYAQRIGADEILIFDFAENEATACPVLGYDILDGAFRYSLLTNFGNDIAIVNGFLSPNGLIVHADQAAQVHKWFNSHMSDDPHVIGSRLFRVYEKCAQQSAAPLPSAPQTGPSEGGR